MLIRICLLMVSLVWSAVLCAQDPISEAEAWALGSPSMQGPYGNFQVPQTSVELIDDLSEAKFVWESEDSDFGRAKHTTGAFKSSTPEGGAQKIRDILGPSPKATPGGWAAPIVADGKLFASTFKPAGKLYDVESLYGSKAKAYLEADDLLIALDAKTGKTVLKAA